MKKTGKAVKHETKLIAAGTLILSALMQAVFLIIGKWSLPVLYGNIVSAAVSILNFFLLGRTIEKAVTMEEADAKKFMTMSNSLRSLGLVVIIGAAVIFSKYFNLVSLLVPLFFPRIIMAARPRLGGYVTDDDVSSDESNTSDDNTHADIPEDHDDGSGED